MCVDIGGDDGEMRCFGVCGDDVLILEIRVVVVKSVCKVDVKWIFMNCFGLDEDKVEFR